ncbi:putative small metal-binding protein [Mangrovibacterium marinum]|uniref:Putative small metal-binding protein n=1 Tax=Mangrovibacterium marinum TaxID=1639118 RepID=A0A2T5C160_9BACT|nr:DUF1059 domain-containing protein [Mangrovibacterium marinum]PTN08315.1 putative small metal-binding protein [Mangrovibacterium marinum]
MGRMKVVRRSDAGFDSTFVARSESEEDLMNQVAKHAQAVHGMEINEELVPKVKSLIHEEVN